MPTRTYTVVIEGEAPSLSAWVPELPGCVAAGESREEILELIRGAIAMHTEDDPDLSPAVPSEVVRVEA